LIILVLFRKTSRRSFFFQLREDCCLGLAVLDPLPKKDPSFCKDLATATQLPLGLALWLGDIATGTPQNKSSERIRKSRIAHGVADFRSSNKNNKNNETTFAMPSDHGRAGAFASCLGALQQLQVGGSLERRPPGSIAMGGQPPFENLAGLQLFESHRSWTSLSSRNRFNLASDCTFASTTPSLEPTPRECLGARTGVGRSHESRVLMWVIHFCHLSVDALVLFLTLRKCKSRSQRIDCALQCRLHRGVSLALT